MGSMVAARQLLWSLAFPIAALGFTGLIIDIPPSHCRFDTTRSNGFINTASSSWRNHHLASTTTGTIRSPSSPSSSWRRLHHLASSLASPVKGSSQQEDDSSMDVDKENFKETFQELCHEIKVQPEGLVRLDESSSTGIRGVYLQRDISKGDVILSIPLQSCLRDDQPPEWMLTQPTTDDNEDEDMDDGVFNPSEWATRLAASLLDLQLNCDDESRDGSNNNNNNVMDLWLSLLPDPDFLRASLPIHWPEETLASSQCSALELAVDTAFFTRAQAREDVLQALNENRGAMVSDLDDQTKRRLCDNALDLVQTRSCRVLVDDVNNNNDKDDPQPLRLLSPVFDFINHPSQGRANAGFTLEKETSDDNNDGPRLVVRSLRDLEANTEVLIDYGESARPAWRCLSSYGFVPTYEPGMAMTSEDDDNEENHVAEVFVNGVRYQVGPSSVPQEMVAAMAAALDPSSMNDSDEQVVLTKEIAIMLGQRIAEDAFHKLLDPPEIAVDEENDDELQTAEQILSSQQAAALRFYQHRVLMDCSLGLRDWAVQQQ